MELLSRPTSWIVLCAVACGLLLWSEYRTWRPGIWSFKLLASSAFVATALGAGALDSGYGRFVLCGLALCWLGDLLLIPERSETAFLAGIGSFLLGHVAYAIAFWRLPLSGLGLALAGVAIAGLGALVLRWLRPHLTGIFRAAVPAYVAVIGVMLATAMATFVAGSSPAIAIGALLFAVSDLSVARNRLVQADFATVAWGLPLYFAGQLFLATSVAG